MTSALLSVRFALELEIGVVMTARPRRPREHVLEDASRVRFESAIEPWIYRQQSHDYGIDGEAEIVLDGEATGLFFKVQLKGTDKPVMPKGHIVRLSREQNEYFNTLRVPTLIVLFARSEEVILTRWFQSFDPRNDSDAEKSIGLRFNANHAWHDGSLDELRLALRTYHQLRDVTSALPVALEVVFEADQVAGVHRLELAVELATAADDFPQVVRLVDNPADAIGFLRIQSRGISVDFRTIASATAHYADPWEHDPIPLRLVADAYVSLAYVLARFGLVDAAAQLYVRFLPDSSSLLNHHFFLSATWCLAESHRVSELFPLIDAAQRAAPDESDLTQMLASITWSRLKGRLSPADTQAVADYLAGRIRDAKTGSIPERVGIAEYNLANWLQSNRRHAEALEHYGRVMESAPTYSERPYFWAERAGSYFECEDFEEAVDAYRRAIKLGEDGELQALLADSLLMAGRYRQAQKGFKKITWAQDEVHPEWWLKSWILDEVVEFGGEQQHRDASGAMELAVIQDGMSGRLIRKRLVGALKLDALCGTAWHNLGIFRLAKDSHGACDAFVAAAVVVRGAPELWVRATFLAFVTQQTTLFRKTVECALFFCRKEYIQLLMGDIRSLGHPEAQTYFLEAVQPLLTAPPVREHSLTLRIPTPEGLKTMVIGFDS